MLSILPTTTWVSNACIYSCANDMGDTVGMSREGYLKIGWDDPQIWCHHYFFSNSDVKTVIAQELEEAYGGDVHVHENTWPGLMGILTAMHALVAFMYVMVVVFILVVTVMTGSKILTAEQRDTGIYKAIGFSDSRLRVSFALRSAVENNPVVPGWSNKMLACIPMGILQSLSILFIGKVRSSQIRYQRTPSSGRVSKAALMHYFRLLAQNPLLSISQIILGLQKDSDDPWHFLAV